MSAKILKFKSFKKPISSSSLKYSPHINRTLGSLTATLLFASLERRFQKKPEGFYKFSAPCNSPYYRKGSSLCEEVGVRSSKTISRALELICTRYKSKSLYNVAREQYGEICVFQGKPYLSYQNRITGQTFYLRDYRAVQEIKNGTYKCDKNAKK